MLPVFDSLRSVTELSVLVRLFLTVICGSLIGLERERKHRPAGFRTHILICLGAAMTTLLGQYLCLNKGYPTDMSRLGAQVVAGVGFIGAGTIIVTRRKQVKGLTTAAGLWTSAIVGLAMGSGFYEAGLCGTVLTLMAELLFTRLEYRICSTARDVNLYVEYLAPECLTTLTDMMRNNDVKITDLEITRAAGENANSCAIFSLRFDRRGDREEFLTRISKVENVVAIEEL